MSCSLWKFDNFSIQGRAVSEMKVKSESENLKKISRMILQKKCDEEKMVKKKIMNLPWTVALTLVRSVRWKSIQIVSYHRMCVAVCIHLHCGKERCAVLIIVQRRYICHE